MVSSLPLVSIFCITYNQESFIREALDGFLMQQTNFPFEIIIHDDASTDNTANIIREYQAKHPDVIKPILQTKNQYSSIGFGFISNIFKQAQGKYIALCEGDDYWTVDNKLQKQVDMLETHPEYSICFHNAFYFREGDQNLQRTNNLEKSVYTIRDLFISNFIPTASVMYRAGIVKEIPAWFYELSMADWPLHILHAIHGKIGYIDEVMSVYRIHAGGMWSSKSRAWTFQKIIQMFNTVKNNIDSKYTSLIDKSIEMYSQQLSQLSLTNQKNVIKISGEIVKKINKNENLQALDLIQSWDRKNNTINYVKAVALARQGKITEALASLETLLNHNPTHPKGIVLRKELRKNLTSNTTDFHPIIEKANNLLEANQIVEAFKILNDAKALKQPMMGLDYCRAKCFLQMRQPAASIQALYEELRYFPDNDQAEDFLNQLLTQYPQFVSRNIQDPEFQEIYRLIQPYTMLSEARLYSLFTLIKRICEENIPGNFVECGVAAGGSTALVAAVIKRYTKQPRWVYAFDSFDGMPAPTEKDKSNGIPAEVTGWGTGTCAAPEASVKEICNKLGVGNIVQLVKGYFEDTLPKLRNQVGMIALLHMDGDWYESTKTIISNLYDRISNDGFAQVDNYGFWEGCRQALHEFETERQLKFELHQIDGTGVWFNCPNKFAINPVFENSLIAEFDQDDPVKYGIQSQMSKNERFQLYYALRQLLPVTYYPFRFIEIGSFAGSSLFLNHKALARGHNNLQGWAIDPGLHPQLKLVLDNLPPEITHLRMFSHDALVQLQQVFEQDGNYPPYIFVDGDHSYAGVKQDIINYYPLLAPGGLMIFHDYLPPLDEQNSSSILFHHGGNEPGIRKACQELMENTYHCEIIEVPLLYPDDPTQTQAYLPIIPGVFSSLKIYRKPSN